MGQYFLHALVGLCCLSNCCLTAARAPSGKSAKPNIVFILADDHASEALTCYNPRSPVATPGIDRLAKEGMRFETCLGVNSLCAPSRAAMLSGRYSHLNGFRRNGDQFDGSQLTFPKVLKAAGYETALLGKWHLGSRPTGFDHWSILPGQGRYVDPLLETAEGREKHSGHFTTLITDHAIEWLKQRSGDRPFCLLVHHKAPHTPHQAAEPFASRFRDVELLFPDTFNDDFDGRAALRESLGRFSKLSKANPSHFNQPRPEGLSPEAYKRWAFQIFFRGYYALVAQLDHEVGRFLSYLDDSGLAENTVVVYGSDNGFFLGDHGLMNKMWMYEESLRVPLIIRWPGVVKPGMVNTDLTSLLDIAPSFVDFAGESIPSEFQGRSLLPLIKGERSGDWRQSHYYRYYDQYDVPSHLGLRTSRHKLIRFDAPDRPPSWELFDLRDDPWELKNLAGTGEREEIRMRGLLEAEQKRLRDRDMAGQP